MTEPVALVQNVWITGQMSPQRLTELAARLGLKRVVNHRPDHEEAGQPTSADLAAAAAEAGLAYVAAPISGLPSADAVEATALVLSHGEPTLMFCRSGMRSTAAWAMAERLNGADPEELRAAAGQAGYDLSRLPL